MSCNPHLIIINDVDQRNVTSNAMKIAAILEIDFEKIIASLKIIYLTEVLLHKLKGRRQKFFLMLPPAESWQTEKKNNFRL